MSGGSLDYFYCQLQEHVGDFKDKELDELVKDLAELFHDREWYLSADYDEDDWNKARDEFKKKWFGEGVRAERIAKYLDEVKLELLQSFAFDHTMDRPKGEWKENVTFYKGCSKCGAYVWSNLNGLYLNPRKLNFCPNCGADMRGGEERNDQIN